MKILLYDIETGPNLGYIWGKYEQNVLDYKNEWYILCFSAKWLDSKKTISRSLPDYKNYKKDKTDDSALVQDLWNLFNEADIVIAHNGLNFDNKKATARFIFHNFPPPAPYKTIDTLREIKRVASFNSHKLDDLGKTLGLGRKIKTDFLLWVGCINGDMKSWQRMKSYNRRDVLLLEKFYKKILPYIRHHNQGNYDDKNICPRCGSSKIQFRGYAVSLTAKYRRFQCLDCGGWSRTTKNIQKIKTNIAI